MANCQLPNHSTSQVPNVQFPTFKIGDWKLEVENWKLGVCLFGSWQLVLWKLTRSAYLEVNNFQWPTANSQITQPPKFPTFNSQLSKLETGSWKLRIGSWAFAYLEVGSWSVGS